MPNPIKLKPPLCNPTNCNFNLPSDLLNRIKTAAIFYSLAHADDMSQVERYTWNDLVREVLAKAFPADGDVSKMPLKVQPWGKGAKK